MIAPSLTFLKDQLDASLRAKNSADDELVVLSPLHPNAEIATNKVLISLINISKDQIPHANDQRRHQPSSLHLDVHVMISANFPQNYAQSLTFLADTLSFFDVKPVFTPQSAPDLPQGIQKLSLEMTNLSLEDQHSLWATHGATYRPSILYKMRGVTLEDEFIMTAAPEITAIGLEDGD